MAKRIQRKRTRGWKMPEGAVYVGRPTRWGNPYKINFTWERGMVVECFEEHLNNMPKEELEKLIEPLRGKDLACFCPLDEPCHADVLLRLANKAWSGLVESGRTLPAEIVVVESVEPA
ncbi:MAG: hypothetical protein HKUEN02_22480 [Anaerolineaceae bacterium]|nr:MAG: hypothetical protein HKUEN02_22480 [Anaerolineaceae bacterium]